MWIFINSLYLYIPIHRLTHYNFLKYSNFLVEIRAILYNVKNKINSLKILKKYRSQGSSFERLRKKEKEGTKIVVNTSRVIASRVTQGTITLSLLPSTKAVSGRGGGGGREWPTSSSSPNTRHAYPAVRFSRSRLDEGGTRRTRGTLVPTLSPRESRQASGPAILLLLRRVSFHLMKTRSAHGRIQRSARLHERTIFRPLERRRNVVVPRSRSRFREEFLTSINWSKTLLEEGSVGYQFWEQVEGNDRRGMSMWFWVIWIEKLEIGDIFCVSSS